MASKVILNAKIALFQGFLKLSLLFNKNARMGPILKQCSIKSSLPSPLSCDKLLYSSLSYTTSDAKLVGDLGTRLFNGLGYVPCTSHFFAMVYSVTSHGSIKHEYRLWINCIFVTDKLHSCVFGWTQVVFIYYRGLVMYSHWNTMDVTQNHGNWRWKMAWVRAM